jgi:hypothetical protein
MEFYRKAIFGGLMAFLGALGTALTDGHVTTLEWVGVAATTVAAAAAVWGIRNEPLP